MAFNPSKKEVTDFNNGVKYRDNVDGLGATAINNIIEGLLYAQERAVPVALYKHLTTFELSLDFTYFFKVLSLSKQKEPYPTGVFTDLFNNETFIIELVTAQEMTPGFIPIKIYFSAESGLFNIVYFDLDMHDGIQLVETATIYVHSDEVQEF